MKKTTIVLLTVSLMIVIGYSCKHRFQYNGELITESPCDPNTVYFQNTILPLLNSRCAMPGCHDAITQAEGINLTSYTSIMNSNNGELVSANDPNGSKLYEVILDGEMPEDPYPPLTAQEMQLIYDWIAQGALNNYCADCDTSKYLFAADILPLINSRCTGCHGTVSPNGGITLTSYANISTVANNGFLMGVVTGTGYPLMPPSVNLPDCEKTKIINWINDGAQNN
jgi:hypothetical protein